LTVDVSFPLELITKLTPAVMEPVGTESCPRVPPVVFLETNIKELEVTAVVATVTVPGVPERAAEVPADALDPVAIVILFPAVDKARLPFVAVMFPKVAVKLVVAATDPGAIKADGVDRVKVDPEPVEVIWEAVPKILIFPAVGETAPLPPVIVCIDPDDPEVTVSQTPGAPTSI
jgi:hypothetical protein